MEKEPSNINLSKLMEIANSTAGQELLSLVQNKKDEKFDEAMQQAQSGDFSQAQVKAAVNDALAQAGLYTPAATEAPTEEVTEAATEATQAAKTAGELILDSYKATADNSYAVDYLEQDPYLVNLYEGFGFAKQYDSARGHEYSLEDLANTATLSEALSGEEMSLLVSLLQKPELLNRSGQSLRDYIGRIKERRDEAGQAGDLRALASRYREKKGYEG